MKFAVTCLLKGTRVPASQSKVFDSLMDAVKYGGTIAEKRKAMTVPIIDTKGAADSVFNHIVEKCPSELKPINHRGGPVRFFVMYEQPYTIAFVGNDFATGFNKDDYNIFVDEFNRLAEGSK